MNQQEIIDSLKRTLADSQKVIDSLEAENAELKEEIDLNNAFPGSTKLNAKLMGEIAELKKKLEELEPVPMGYYRCGGCNGIFHEGDSHTCTMETLT